MKKFYLAASLLLLSTMGFSQGVQRTMLVEEFTNASCPPCAATNPSFNALLNQNMGKVAKIKYQTNWPGADPMNAQTQTLVAPRVTYYGVTGVPNTEADGNVFNDHPANFTQATIDGRYPVLSPTNLTVNHVISADLDSIYITITVNPVVTMMASATTKLKLRVAMTETAIAFGGAPGTNGETEFFDVMRDMYPNAVGTTMLDTLAAGSTYTFTFAKGIPTYVYDKAEIGVVAFLQDDGTKEVFQSDFSEPVPFTLDAKAIGLSVPSFICGQTTTNGTFTLKNVGTTTMTACDLLVSVDGNLVASQPWTGSLATGQSAQVTINNIPTTAGGSHALTVSCSLTGEINVSNNGAASNFAVASAPQALPLTQGFDATVFPPVNWGREDMDNDATGWERRTNASGFGGSAACVRVYFYNSPDGAIDNLYMPKLNLSTAATARMTMSHAYAGYTAATPENDQVNIQYSKDCGATWTNLWSKAGNALKTAAPTTSSFVPTAAQWAKDTISLNAICGQSDVLLRFNGVSNYGNNALFDDINIEVVNGLGVDKFDQINFSVYPNPAKANVNVDLNLKSSANVNVSIFSTTGQLVQSQEEGKLAGGAHKINVNTSNLASGSYMLMINAEGVTKSQILTIE